MAKYRFFVFTDLTFVYSFDFVILRPPSLDDTIESSFSSLQPCQITSVEEKMPWNWFDDVPPEIRNNIYHEFFKSMKLSNNVYQPDQRNDDGPQQKVLRSAPLNLFLSSKRCKEEAEPSFWALGCFTFTIYFYHHSGGPPLGQVDKIRSLKLRGFSGAVFDFLDQILPSREEVVSKKMSSLEIEAPLDMFFSEPIHRHIQERTRQLTIDNLKVMLTLSN